MTTPFNPRELIDEIFGQRPELAFLGALGQSRQPQSLEQFFRSRTSDFLQRYQQAIGQKLIGGEIPTLTPETFFRGLDFRQEALRFSPKGRGMGVGQFAPPARFLFR